MVVVAAVETAVAFKLVMWVVLQLATWVEEKIPSHGALSQQCKAGNGYPRGLIKLRWDELGTSDLWLTNNAGKHLPLEYRMRDFYDSNQVAGFCWVGGGGGGGVVEGVVGEGGGAASH
jgi:hypothetical protein